MLSQPANSLWPEFGIEKTFGGTASLKYFRFEDFQPLKSLCIASLRVKAS